MDKEVTTLMSGLAMGESARWHEGRFWCSDWVAGEILTIDLEGMSRVVARPTSMPFCFDWLGDGTMLITTANGLAQLDPASEAEPGPLVDAVDLTSLGVVGGWNEVIAARGGHVFVNAINFDMYEHGMDFELGSRSGVIAVVTPEGEARLAAEEVAFPNGMAITSDGSTLIVAESFASRLGAWDIEPDGRLSNRRVWAEVPDGADGISIDAEDAVWCATQKGCARVREGGEITDTIPLELFGFSCALGGPSGRTLFIVANDWNGPESIGQGPRTGEVFMVDVDVAAPGKR